MNDHSFGFFIFSFWWLIFPIMGFVFGGFNMWMAHRRSQQAMDILKSYADQGKDPPPEILAAVTGTQASAGPGPYGAPYAGWGYRGWGYGRWGWRGPLWSWSRVVTFGAISVGFALAGQYIGEPEAVRAFHVVSIITGVLAAAFAVMAVIHTVFFRDAQRP